MPNPYETGRRDGERGLDKTTAYDDMPAHANWASHVGFHAENTPSTCALDCGGLVHVPEVQRKQLRQVPYGLANMPHHCQYCGAIFETESKAAERAEYEAGFQAGSGSHAAQQQRRRAEQQRRQRRGHQ